MFHIRCFTFPSVFKGFGYSKFISRATRRSQKMKFCLLTDPPATNAVPLAGSTLRFDLPCALCLFRRPALLPFHLFRPFPYLSPKYKKT